MTTVVSHARSKRILGMDVELGGEKKRTNDIRSIPELVAKVASRAGWQTNGGDLGDDLDHVELRVPECSDVRMLVHYERAMHLIAAQYANKVGLDLFNHLADFGDASGGSKSWGGHINIFTNAPFHAIRKLMPFFVSSIPLTGAGGIEPVDGGIVFTCNKRACHLNCDIDYDTVASKPIINTRNEPEASVPGFWRYHHTSMETNMSYVQRLVAIGSLELMIRLAEDEVHSPLKGIALPDIEIHSFSLLSNVHRIATQTKEWRVHHVTRFPRSMSSTISAVGMQHEYWKAAKKFYYDEGSNIDRFIINEWRKILDQLSSPDPVTAAYGTLDWATKLALSRADVQTDQFTLAHLDQLKVMELSYHRLGADADFAMFEEAGLFKHRPQKEEIAALRFKPPNTTRAFFRGNLIKKLNETDASGTYINAAFDWGECHLGTSSDSKTFELPDPRLTYAEYLPEAEKFLRKNTPRWR